MPELETAADTAKSYSAPNNSDTLTAPKAAELPDVRLMLLTSIAPSPLNPRRTFDEAGLTSLANSIRMHGVEQPIKVRPPRNGGLYEIVMGERRWHAAKMVGLPEIPVIVQDMEDAELAERALIENLQRADLNCVEEAHGYQNVLELNKSLTQVSLGQRLSVSQSRISNILRLLGLPIAVQKLLTEDKISRSHGIELASIAKDAPEETERLAQKAWQEKWTQDMLRAAIEEVKAKTVNTAQTTLELSAPKTPPYVHTPNPATTTAPAVVAEKVTTTETTKTESLSAAGSVVPKTASASPAAAPSTPSQDALVKEVSQTLSDAAAPAEPAPVTANPAPATLPASSQNEVITTVPDGPRVATSISAADDDYLFEAMLTIDQLFAKYKKLADNPFALSSNAVKYLKALTDNYNEKHVDEPLAPIAFLEYLLASQASEAGFDVATLKEIPE